MKKPFETEMDDTRQAVGQIVCLCTTIALHQEFGVGKTRLERIKARIDELENQNTEVIMTPDANGRPSKDKAEAIRESWLAGCVSSDYRIPMVRMPRGRKEQQYRMAGDRAAKIAWQIYAKAVIDVLHYGPDRLERLRKESHANYEQLNKWGHGFVIGEFTCYKIDTIQRMGIDNNFDYCYLSLNEFGNDDIAIEIRDIEKSCIPKSELNSYAKSAPELFAWHISDLKVYDTPRDLDEFSRFGFFGMGRSNCVCGNWRCENYEPSYHYMIPPTCKIEGCSIYRAPQSWCYVTERMDE